jgi:hypothetical protein
MKNPVGGTSAMTSCLTFSAGLRPVLRGKSNGVDNEGIEAVSQCHCPPAIRQSGSDRAVRSPRRVARPTVACLSF